MAPKVTYTITTDILKFSFGNENNSSYRLRINESNAIFEIVAAQCAIHPNDSEEAIAEKKAIEQAFLQYKKDNLDYEHSLSRKPRRICYDNLDEVLNIGHISWSEYLQYVSVDPDMKPFEPQWALEEEKQLCRALDETSEDMRKKLLNLIMQFAPKASLELYYADSSPIRRLVAMVRTRDDAQKKASSKMMEKNMLKAYDRLNQPSSESAIPISQMAYYAYNCDVSLHWLLNIKSCKCLLTPNETTETIMDVFCLLGDERRNMFINCIKNLNLHFED